jgi:hypothetical protein
MNARFFYVLHDATHKEFMAIKECIDIDFYCIIEKTVNKNRMIRCDIGSTGNKSAQRGIVINDLHSAATQNK